MKIKDIVELVNTHTDEEIRTIIKTNPEHYIALLQISVEKYKSRVERVIRESQKDTLYNGQTWVAKEDCMNNFRQGCRVTIDRIDLTQGSVVIDGAVSTDIDTLRKYFVPA